MEEKEYVNGNTFSVLRKGTLSDGGGYHILDGGNILILTVPRNITEEVIRTAMKDSYDEHKWGFYYFAFSKRNIIPVSDCDVECLEECVKKI